MISALPVVGVDKIEAGVRPRMELPLHVLYLPTGEWAALPVHVHPYPLLQQAHIPLPTHTVGTVDFYIHIAEVAFGISKTYVLTTFLYAEQFLPKISFKDPTTFLRVSIFWT